uniref:Wax synthase domain-containing protein n=1 Tax=Oryza punctata TaxID=4537 RepID=A0A0E0M413_ORYPU
MLLIKVLDEKKKKKPPPGVLLRSLCCPTQPRRPYSQCLSQPGVTGRMPAYAVVAFDDTYVYLMLELFLAFVAAAACEVGAVPYVATSLANFWGHCWNLMVPAVLRPSVYHPVHAIHSAVLSMVATFLVSEIMHKVMFYYITLKPSNTTGEVPTWRWRQPHTVATTLTLVFMMGTGFWLFPLGSQQRHQVQMTNSLFPVID